MKKIEQFAELHWAQLQQYLSCPKGSKDGRGRQAACNLEIFKALLYVLNTGCSWRSLPLHYPPYQTVYHRYRQWLSDGSLNRVLDVLYKSLKKQGVFDESCGSVDGTFVHASNGGNAVGHGFKGKGSTVLVMVDGHGIPIGIHLVAANHPEVHAVQSLIDFGMMIPPPPIIAADKGFISDDLTEELAIQHDIEWVTPAKTNSKSSNPPDEKIVLKNRWKVERFFAWMKKKRRLNVRYDRIVNVFMGWMKLYIATMLLTLELNNI